MLWNRDKMQIVIVTEHLFTWICVQYVLFDFNQLQMLRVIYQIHDRKVFIPTYLVCILTTKTAADPEAFLGEGEMRKRM